MLCLCVLSVSHKWLSWSICLNGQLKSEIVLGTEVKSHGDAAIDGVL